MLYFWEKFWFESKPDVQVGYFRTAFLSLAFIFYLLKLFDLDFLYSTSGLVEKADLDMLINPLYRLHYFSFPETVFGIKSFFGVLFLGFFVGILGFLPRVLYLFLLMMHLLLVHRNPTVIYGADMLISLGLFGLFLMGSGASLFFKNRGEFYFLKDFRESLTSAGVRVIQIQVSLIYLFTALEKVRGESWWSGTALWEVFNNSQMMVVDLSFIGGFPSVVVFMTWFVIVFELFFSFAVWTEARNFFLLFGFIFHLLIAFLMGLWFFSFFMLSFYLLFLNNPNNELNDYGLRS